MTTAVNIPVFFRAMFEVSANRLLSLKDDADDGLTALEGKVVEVRVKGFEFVFFLVVISHRVAIFDTYHKAADVSISGLPSALVKLLVQDDIMMLLQTGEIEMQGDIGLGRKLKQIFMLASVDWEEVASAVVGDTPAYQLGKVFRNVSASVQQLMSSVKSNVSEYLQEETRDFPTVIEVENFIKDTDELRNDAQRALQRAQKISMLINQE